MIKPGVKIQFDGGDAGLTISGTAAIKMIGTAAKPIILEGKVTSAGSWKGVVLEANNLENQWEYVTLRHAGSVQATAAGLLVEGYNESKIGVKNCTFSDNIGYGIRVGADGTSSNWYTKCKFTSFSNNTFSNNSKSAMRIHYSQWGYLDSKTDYLNNGQKYIEIFCSNIDNYDALLESPATIEKLNVPYRVFGILKPNESFIFSKGVEVQFGTDAGIFLGTNKKTAAIIANGTATEPIKFVGYLANTKGVWAGISTQNGNIETKFNYCIIDGAGSTAEPFFCVVKTSKAAIYLGLEYSCTPEASKGTITNCTILNSGGYGIAYRLADAVTVKDNTFKDNTKADVYNFK
jgi:parallel beta-helix repeat protein